jgi:hypothetical protein
MTPSIFDYDIIKLTIHIEESCASEIKDGLAFI